MIDLTQRDIQGKIRSHRTVLLENVKDVNLTAEVLRFGAQPKEVPLRGALTGRQNLMAPVKGSKCLGGDPAIMLPNLEGVQLTVREIEISANNPRSKATDNKVLRSSLQKPLRELLGLGPGWPPTQAVAVQHLQPNMTKVVDGCLKAARFQFSRPPRQLQFLRR